MYLSRVKIDINNRKKVKDLNHLGAYHSWVEECFPDEFAIGKRSRKLWRIDYIDNEIYLLVLSQKTPDLKALEKYGIPGSAQTKNYTILLNKLRVGDKLRFRLVLNPVVSLSQGKSSGKRGRVVPLITESQQFQYLKQIAPKHGFSVKDNDFLITNRGFEILKRNNKKELKICKVDYGGVLKIEDLELFKSALINGLGKKKAFGFGFLTVIPGNE